MEKIFKLKENRTTVRTEIAAGLTSFITMAYIIALNPNLLTDFGRGGGQPLWNAVFLATCIASAIGTIVMAFLANKPFAMAPGMGVNTFFAVIVSNIISITGMSYLSAFRSALSIVLTEGIVFLILSVLSIREKFIEAIPMPIRMGIGPAIGMMLLEIGLGSNAAVYDSEGRGWFVLRDFFGSLTAGYASNMMKEAYPGMILTIVTIFAGIIIMAALSKRGIKAYVLFGILAAAGIYWAGEAVFLGANPFAGFRSSDFIPPFGDLISQTLFKVDFHSFLDLGIFTSITLILTLCLVDMFDTIGALVGTASRANMLDENGNMPGMKQALLADAVGTVAGGLSGTSTVTTYIESAAGVEAGGRTGLAALTSGIMFLACMFLGPAVGVIPAAATSSALIYVGAVMFTGIKKIALDSVENVLPVAVMVIAMPVSGSVGHAIGLAMVLYTAIKIVSGKAKEVSVITYIISAMFGVKFFLMV